MQAERALEVYDEMFMRGLDPNVHTYNLLISAFSRQVDTATVAGSLSSF